ncbi:MAG: flagellar assembly protein FliW [Actinobacteria bacterium]|nr:flagellar assembly protein FliW [Actinomycetota bacterium]
MTAENDELPIIEFVTPIPGFPGHRRFLLTIVDERGLLYALRSVDDPELRFLVIAPAPFFPDYAPELDPATLVSLGVSDPARLLVLLVVTVADVAAGATANLFAPIVVDQQTRRAVQVVLSGTELPIRAPLAMDSG